MNPRSWARAAARPLMRFVDRRIAFRQAPIIEQLEALKANTAELRRDIDRSISAVLSALSTQNAESRMGARSLAEERRKIVSELSERLDAIERQIDLFGEALSGPDEEVRDHPAPRLLGDGTND